MELNPGYKQTEVGVIPEDWDAVPLRRTCRAIYRGASPRPIGDPRWFDQGSDIGWVRISDVTRSRRYLRETTQRLSEEGIKRSRFIPRGSLIMSICATVGRPIETAVNTCIHDGFVVFEKPGVDQGFLYHVLCDLEPRWATKGQTGSQMNLNTNLIKITSIPLPPTEEEQRAIATALSDVDALLDGLDRLIAKKRDLKQAAMQQLLTGETRLPGFEGEWVDCKLVELANFYDNLRIPVKESKREIGVTPYYGANGIQGYIKGYTHDGEFVLIAEDGANDLNDYPVFYVNGKVWVNNHAHVIQGIPDKAKTKYLSYALKSVDFVQILVGGTRAKLNGSEAKAIKIIVPSDIEEQSAIAAVLSDMDAEIAALEQRRNKTKDIKQAMMQELLTGSTRLI